MNPCSANIYFLSFIRFLSDIQLTSECFEPNVETNRKVVAGEKATILPDNKLFSGIGRSCPNLNRLDLRDVPRLSPDCLLFLVFSDPFRYLHKYMYLKHGSEETPRKHDDCKQSLLFPATSKLTKYFKKYTCAQKYFCFPGYFLPGRYCPYCEDPAFDSGIRPGYELSEDQHIFALADVMYQFMESTEDHHRKASMLR